SFGDKGTLPLSIKFLTRHAGHEIHFIVPKYPWDAGPDPMSQAPSACRYVMHISTMRYSFSDSAFRSFMMKRFPSTSVINTLFSVTATTFPLPIRTVK